MVDIIDTPIRRVRDGFVFEASQESGADEVIAKGIRSPKNRGNVQGKNDPSLEIAHVERKSVIEKPLTSK